MKLKSIFHQTLPVWQTQTYFKHCTVQLVKQDLALQSFTLRTSAGFWGFQSQKTLHNFWVAPWQLGWVSCYSWQPLINKGITAGCDEGYWGLKESLTVCLFKQKAPRALWLLNCCKDSIDNQCRVLISALLMYLWLTVAAWLMLYPLCCTALHTLHTVMHARVNQWEAV